MDCVSPILDILTRVCDCAAKHTAYIKDMQKNMESLRNAMEELKNVRDDLKGRVEREEEQPRRMRRTNEVEGWLDRVQALETEVSEVLRKGDREIQKKCIGNRCPGNCRSSYKLGRKASAMLPAVTELRGRGHFDVVAVGLPQPPADERPMQKTVGLDLMYTEVCRCIQDEKLGIIGLYGMGGAGKTTLMTKLNNEFIRASKDFDVAIWVVVSRPASVEKVQEVIRNKLDIPEDRWRNRTKDEKAVEIFSLLKAKRFVLLLDDVWERLDLQAVGVPPPNNSQNRSKVILTTRSLDVCRRMEAQTSIKVKCLTDGEAINLFKEKVGETTLNSHPEIPLLAEIAAKECKGLPLALVTIGRAMVGKTSPQEWDRAIQKLKAYPSDLSGMGDHVFPVLKFSYDNLPNDTIKDCFLYLAAFPEDHQILHNELILLWIGEGFLGQCGDIDDAFNKGNDMIEHLKTACLFESGNGYGSVKMHDVIRDMALWLATTHSGNNNKFVVKKYATVESYQTSNWKQAEKIYLDIDSVRLEDFTEPLCFPNLETLFIKGGESYYRFSFDIWGDLGTFFSRFMFPFVPIMPIIKVLDLSNTGITELPIGIGKLVTLEYLDFSYTRLKELSTELKTLKRIRVLVLQGMAHLEMIAKGVLSNLSMMAIFILELNESSEEERGYHSPGVEEERGCHPPGVEEERDCLSPGVEEVRGCLSPGVEGQEALWLRENSKDLLEELEGLEGINLVSFPMFGASSFQKLLSSQKLKHAMRGLRVGKLEGMNSLQLPSMRHLENLRISSCVELQEIKVYHQEGGLRAVAGYYPTSHFCCLRVVNIFELPKLLDLRWLIHIPNLEHLHVSHCQSMKEVIGDVPENVGIFSRLKECNFHQLPNLRRISGRALPFPSLIELQVSYCPILRKLPLDSNSARNSLKAIRGISEWWERLEWEDEAIRLTFTPYFTWY